MSLLETITTGKTNKPPKITIYGNEGLGKSTYASQAPKPIFIPTEDGLNQIDCAKFPLAKSYQSVIVALQALITEEHDYQTVVLDSLSGLERLIHDNVCQRFGVKNIEKADGGYAKGYKHALDEWQEVLTLLDRLRDERNMLVLLIAHMGKITVKPSDSEDYDREAPRLNQKAVELILEWSDCVLYAKLKTLVKNVEGGFNQKRGMVVGRGERVVETSTASGYCAKNRYGLPEELPLDFNALMAELTKEI